MEPCLIGRPVLLVEDNPLDADLTMRALRPLLATHPVHLARDGEAALAWLARWEAGEPKPLVVLLDLNLPRVNGIEVLKAFRAHPAARLIPVVILSTSSQDSDADEAYRAGANSFVVKPVQAEAFADVAAHIERYWCRLNRPV
ncbi:response regulator [Niveibacterium sp. SC-1]|uniref:response regulator n=1 Tax=Niveibacterium sp. SC-1 TaxID=3135646 RepID=UPI00312054F7